MSEEISTESPPPCTAVLDCELRLSRPGSAAEGFLELTLGHADGAVQQLRLNRAGAKRLVERCGAIMLDPPPRLYGTRQWFSRQSIIRAESRIEHDEERIAFNTKQLLPDVAEFVDETIAGLRKIVARRGRSQARPETICRRMRTAMMVLIDALRNDT